MAKLLYVDHAEWRAELPSLREHFDRFGTGLPRVLPDQLDALAERFNA